MAKHLRCMFVGVFVQVMILRVTLSRRKIPRLSTSIFPHKEPVRHSKSILRPVALFNKTVDTLYAFKFLRAVGSRIGRR